MENEKDPKEEYANWKAPDTDEQKVESDYRPELAKELRGQSKEVRIFTLAKAQEGEEYWKARAEKITRNREERQKLKEVREALGQKVEVEGLDAVKARVDKLWDSYPEIQKDAELMSIFDRKGQTLPEKPASEILREHDYPARSKIDNLKFEKWKPKLNPKFIKDDYIYLLRGDNPNIDKKGFYTYPYSFAKTNAEQLTQQLKSPQEVGYMLYGDERYFKTEPHSENIAEQLAYQQSSKGGSTFVSTTTSLRCAYAGTGNTPTEAEQSAYEIYVVKIPISEVINSNTGNHFGMEEDEYLVPDYILPEEVVAKFPRDAQEDIYNFMHETLGVSKEDLRMPSGE